MRFEQVVNSCPQRHIARAGGFHERRPTIGIVLFHGFQKNPRGV
jgi:hypothetical protein